MQEISEIRKILFIDSITSTQCSYQNKLQNYKTQVDVLATANEAWNYIQNINNVDIIICDMHLPETDGVGLYLRLKSAYNTQKLTKPYHRIFILISEDVESSEKARQHGIPFLKKPKNDDDWLELFRVIEETMVLSKTGMAIGGLIDKTQELDTKIKQIDKKVDGIVISLTDQTSRFNEVMTGIQTITKRLDTLPCTLSDNKCTDIGQNVNIIYKSMLGQYVIKNWKKVLLYGFICVIFLSAVINKNTDLIDKLVTKFIG